MRIKLNLLKRVFFNFENKLFCAHKSFSHLKNEIGLHHTHIHTHTHTHTHIYTYKKKLYMHTELHKHP